jgi:hypothetical protein
MKSLRLATMLIALSTSGVASADDPKATEAPAEQPPDRPLPPQQQPAQPRDPQQMPQQPPDPQQQRDPQQQPPAATDPAQPQRTSAEVMKITEQATTHITAAQAALARGDKKAAKQALDQSGRALKKLYDAPELSALLNQMDETIASIEGEGEGKAGKKPRQAIEKLDLAPLSATVRRHQLYLDPSVAAGIDEAAARAKQGDARATADALRLARNRIVVDMAFLPVEDAYVRVLAAQEAIDRGDMKQARQFLHGIPIVIAELQLSTPLVPVRFKLNAAALAAEQGNWDRSRTLVREATSELQAIERASKDTPAAREVSAFVDDVEQLGRQMGSQPRPQPQQIRELAKRTQDLGA